MLWRSNQFSLGANNSRKFGTPHFHPFPPFPFHFHPFLPFAIHFQSIISPFTSIISISFPSISIHFHPFLPFPIHSQSFSVNNVHPFPSISTPKVHHFLELFTPRSVLSLNMRKRNNQQKHFCAPACDVLAVYNSGNLNKINYKNTENSNYFGKHLNHTVFRNRELL